MNRERLVWSPPRDREVLGTRVSPIDLNILGPRQIDGATAGAPLWKATGNLVFTRPIPSHVTPIRFQPSAAQSYDPAPADPNDGDFGTAHVLDDGATLELRGNAWKAVQVNYQVTANTYLEFDFTVDSIGEIQGFGLDVNLHATQVPPPIRKLFGAQANWLGIPLSTIDGYPGSGAFHFEIHLGSEANFDPGLWRYLLFVNDDDQDASGVCRFSNVRFVERPSAATEISTRSYFLSEQARAGTEEQYPGVVSARVRLDSVDVNFELLNQSFRWRRQNALEVDLLLAVDPQNWHRDTSHGHIHAHFHEAVCIGGQIDLDQLGFQQSGSATNDHVIRWQGVFEGFGPALSADGQSPRSVSVTPSGLSLLARPVLSWTDAELAHDLPLLLSLPLDARAEVVPGYLHVRVDEERLQAQRFAAARAELVRQFDELDATTRVPAPADPDAPRWLSLRLNRTAGLPVFHWERTADDLEFIFQPGTWELGFSNDASSPRANLRCFPHVKITDQGEGENKVLTLKVERHRADAATDLAQFRVKVMFHESGTTPTDVPDSLQGVIRLSADAIEIDDPRLLAAKSGAHVAQAIDDLESLPSDDTPSFRLAVARVSGALRRYTSRLSYRYDANHALPEELQCERAPLGYQPTETAEFLRQLHGLPSPTRNDFEVTAEDWVDPPVLWGFLKLEDGWVELPFLNVTDQVYTDLFLSPGSPSLPFVSGAAVFSNGSPSGPPPDREHLWSLSLTDVAGVTGALAFRPLAPPGVARLKSVEIQWLRPTMTVEGLAWLGTAPPRREDGLPDLDNWMAGLQPLVLRTLDEQTNTPSPLQLELNDLSVMPRPQSGELLGGWSLTVGINDDPTLIPQARLKPKKVLRISPKGRAGVLSWLLAGGPYPESFLAGADATLDAVLESPFQRDDLPPLIWRRHPTLPVVQSLPLTQGNDSRSYPAGSRELMPLQVELGAFSLLRDTPSNGGAGGAQPHDARPLWLPNAFRLGVPKKADDAAWAAATSYPTLQVKESESARFREALGAYSSLSGVFLSLPGWTWQPQEALGVLWQDLWPNQARLPEAGLRVQLRAGVPVLDQTVALASHDATNASGDSQEVDGLASATPQRRRDEIPGRERYPALWRDLNEKSRFAECAAEYLVRADFPAGANQLHIRHVAEPLVWETTGAGAAGYPGRVELRNSSDAASLLLEGIDALRGIEGAFEPRDGSRMLLAGGGPWQVTAGSLQSPLATRTIDGSETPLLRDQRGWSRGFAEQPGSASLLVSRPAVFHREAADQLYQLRSSLQPLKLYAGRSEPNHDAVWCLSFTDLPFDETGAFDLTNVRSQLAEDVNDPALSAADRAVLTGYRWSLTAEAAGSNRALLLAGVFPFFPLRLQAAKIVDNEVAEIRVIGRLQLPMLAEQLDQALGEMERWSNAVSVTFSRDHAREPLRLRSLDVVPGERLDDDPLERVSMPAEIQWPLVYDSGAPAQQRQPKPMLVVMPPGYQTSLSTHLAEGLPTEPGNSQTMPRPLQLELAARKIHVPDGIQVTLDRHKGWVFPLAAHEFQMRLDSVGLSVFADPDLAERSLEYDETDAGASVILVRNLLVTFSFQNVVWTRLLNVAGGVVRLDASEAEVSIEPIPTPMAPADALAGHVAQVRLRLRPNEYRNGAVKQKFSHQVFLRFESLWGEAARPQVRFVATCPLLDGVMAPKLVNGAVIDVGDAVEVKSSLRNRSDDGQAQWEFVVVDHGQFKADLARGVIEYQWENLKPVAGDGGALPPAPEVLPGFHVLIAPAPPTAESESPSGFAVMVFDVSGRPGLEPGFSPNAAFVEALLPCQWGREMPGHGRDGVLVEPETLYKSSSGYVYANVTWTYAAGQVGQSAAWKVAVLLNGLLEIANLVSWPVLAIDDDELEYTLPTAAAETERYHHILRILLDQHVLPEALIAGGQGSVLFGLVDDQVWRPVAVVEHRVSRVRKVDGQLQLVDARCFCMSQEIRLGTAAAFRAYLNDLARHSTVDPRRDHQVVPIPNAAFGYHTRSMVDDLLADPLIAGVEKTSVLIVEGSVHGLIGKELRTAGTTATYGVVQVLPRASQQVQLLGAADYQSDFEGGDDALEESPWTLLSLPFLGRLQNRRYDAPGHGAQSRIHVDPVVQLDSGAAANRRLLLHFTSRGADRPIAVRTSVLERSKHRDWLRLDPNTILEGFVRLQTTHRVSAGQALGGAMVSGLNNGLDRVFREPTLTAALEPARSHFPPRRVEGSDAPLHHLAPSFSWYPEARWLMQGAAVFGSGDPADYRAYGVNAIHLSLAMEALRDATEQIATATLPEDQRNFTYHPAVTLLPVIPTAQVPVRLQPVAFGVAPCIALRQERLSPKPDGAASAIHMTFAELLCLSADGSRLEAVLTRTWKAKDTPDDEKLAAWGMASHARLAMDSAVAIVRIRQLVESSSPGQVILNFRFLPLPGIAQPPQLAGQSTAQSSPPALRRAPEPQLRESTSLVQHVVERIGPQPGMVQPLYLRTRPAVFPDAALSPDDPSQAPDDAVWSHGLSALHVDVRTTRGGVNPVGSLVRAGRHEPVAARVWWNSDRMDIQYRVNEDTAARRLPKLFRTSPVGGFLPWMPQPVLPAIAGGELLADERGYPALNASWQSWLSGRYRFLVQGARPGAPLLFHHRLLAREADRLAESGAIAVQYRMTRPMHLPPNLPGDARSALQTVGTSFALHDPPRRLLHVPDWPAVFAAAVLDPHTQIFAVLPEPERISSLAVETIDAVTWRLDVTMHSPDATATYLVEHDPSAGEVVLTSNGAPDSPIKLADWPSRLKKEKLQSLSLPDLLDELDAVHDDSERYSYAASIAQTTAALQGLLSHIAATTASVPLRDQIHALLPKIVAALASPSTEEVRRALLALMTEIHAVRVLAASEPLSEQVARFEALVQTAPAPEFGTSKPWREPANPVVSVQRSAPTWLANVELANQQLVFFTSSQERAVVAAQGPPLLEVTAASKDSFFVDTQPPAGLEIELLSPVFREPAAGAALPVLEAQVRYHRLTLSDLELQNVRLVSLTDGLTFQAETATDGGLPNRLTFTIKDGSENSEASRLIAWMKRAPAGAPLALQMVAGLTIEAQAELGLEIRGFRQQLNLPLRLERSGTRHSPHEPRFQLFEDPEYNRSLATKPARAVAPASFELVAGGERQLFGLTIVADRAEYTNAERILLSWYVDTALFRLDVAPDQFPKDPSEQQVRDLFAAVEYPNADSLHDLQPVPRSRRWTVVDATNNHKFEIRVGQAAVVVHASLVMPLKGRMKIQILRPSGASVDVFEDAGADWAADQIREVDLADRVIFENGNPLPRPMKGEPIGPGDALNVTVTIDSGGQQPFTTVRLNVVRDSTLPPPDAAYALLHARENPTDDILPGKDGVSAPRFAWSPHPLRVEIVNPDDLKASIVRRRAVFQWMHTIRKDEPARYAIQKTTAAGETHVPFVDVGLPPRPSP